MKPSDTFQDVPECRVNAQKFRLDGRVSLLLRTLVRFFLARGTTVVHLTFSRSESFGAVVHQESCLSCALCFLHWGSKQLRFEIDRIRSGPYSSLIIVIQVNATMHASTFLPPTQIGIANPVLFAKELKIFSKKLSDAIYWPKRRFYQPNLPCARYSL